MGLPLLSGELKLCSAQRLEHVSDGEYKCSYLPIPAAATAAPSAPAKLSEMGPVTSSAATSALSVSTPTRSSLAAVIANPCLRITRDEVRTKQEPWCLQKSRRMRRASP